MPSLVSQLIVRLIDEVTGPSKAAGASLSGLGKSIKDLDKIGSGGFGKASAAAKAAMKDLEALEKISEFKTARKGLSDAGQAYRLAAQNARRMASEMAGAESVTAKMQAAYERSVRSADRAKSAYLAQGAAARVAANGLEAAGVAVNRLASAEARLKASIEGASAAMTKQAAKAEASAKRREALSTIGSGAGTLAAIKAKQVGSKAVTSAAEYDYAVRRQRAFAGMTDDDQKKVLQPQARRIATDTKFSNVDVVEAQTTVANRLPEQLKKGEVIAPIIDQVKNYALSMKGVDMDQSAQAVTGFLQSTGKDISTAEKAATEARKATNMLIRMGKLGGMNHDDIMPFVQRGASAGRLAGLSDETMGALAIGMKRSNISGDQAGVALRTMSSKLVSPTRKGLAALDTAGINYDDYVKMPDAGLSTENLEKKFKRDFGKSFTPAIREKLNEALSDTDIVGDRGAFTQAVSEAVSPLFKKKSNGNFFAADANKIAKKVGEFHSLAAENVNAEALLSAIVKADPTLAILNAFATDKHGNKLGLIAKALEQYEKDKAALKNTPNDFGDKISAEITGGLGGAFERLKGAVENAILSIGTANEKWLAPAFDKIGGVLDSFANLSDGARQAGTAIGALTAGAAGAIGAYKIAQNLLGNGASSVALTGSATALTQSAAALNAAALRLGGAGALQGAAGAVGSAASGAAAGTAAGGAAGGALARAATSVPLVAAGAGIIGGGLALRQAEKKATGHVQPGEVHNYGQTKRRDANQSFKETHSEDRIREMVNIKAIPEVDTSKALASVKSAVSEMEAALNVKGSPEVDQSKIQEAVATAKTAGSSMQADLNITARPNVDSSSIIQATGFADALIAKLRTIDAAAKSASNSVRAATRGAYADYGVTE